MARKSLSDSRLESAILEGALQNARASDMRFRSGGDTNAMIAGFEKQVAEFQEESMKARSRADTLYLEFLGERAEKEAMEKAGKSENELCSSMLRQVACLEAELDLKDSSVSTGRPSHLVRATTSPFSRRAERVRSPMPSLHSPRSTSTNDGINSLASATRIKSAVLSPMQESRSVLANAEALLRSTYPTARRAPSERSEAKSTASSHKRQSSNHESATLRTTCGPDSVTQRSLSSKESFASAAIAATAGGRWTPNHCSEPMRGGLVGTVAEALSVPPRSPQTPGPEVAKAQPIRGFGLKVGGMPVQSAPTLPLANSSNDTQDGVRSSGAGVPQRASPIGIRDRDTIDPGVPRRSNGAANAQQPTREQQLMAQLVERERQLKVRDEQINFLRRGGRP